MDTIALLKKIRTIELQTRGLTQQVFAGQYQSAFKGRGMSFSEVRAYQIGDDVRAIDWNVTARFREPFVKVFEEERELTVILVIDVSGSMYFGKGEDSKWSLSVEIAATLGFSAAKKNDKVGAIFVSDKVEAYLPPKKGFGHVHLILRKLIYLKPESKNTNLNEALKYVRNIHKQRGVCFLISDFTDLATIRDGLIATAKKHDLMALQVEDEGESELPDVGFVRWRNSETGLISWVDTSSGKVRNDYAMHQQHVRESSQSTFESLNIDYALMFTGQPVYATLLELFKKRK